MPTESRDFIAYAMQDSGEIAEIEAEQNNLQKLLDSKEVFMIVRQDLRRLFIWKGSVSPVRKRFISARRASLLQEEIRKAGGRALKIVSVDQGEEPAEFLEAFNLESMPVTEVLEDMRYVRNVDRDKEVANPNQAAAPPEGSTAHETAQAYIESKKGKANGAESEVEAAPAEAPAPVSPPVTPEVINTQGASAPAPPEAGAPILFDDADASAPVAAPPPVIAAPPAPPRREPSKDEDTIEIKVSAVKPQAKPKAKPAVKKVKAEASVSPKESPFALKKEAAPPLTVAVDKAAEDAVLKEVQNSTIPAGGVRVNIVVGNKLLGPVVQQKSVLGKSVEKVIWDQIQDLPEGYAEVQGIIRIFTDPEKGIIVAEDIIQTDATAEVQIKEGIKLAGTVWNEILDSVNAVPAPAGCKRMNVILGNSLFGPVTQQQSVLGKSRSKVAWELIKDLPGGCTELSGTIRIFTEAEKGVVKAVDFFESLDTTGSDAKSRGAASPAPTESAPSKRRKLPAIPKAEPEGESGQDQ